jgi:hypothetical protein
VNKTTTTSDPNAVIAHAAAHGLGAGGRRVEAAGLAAFDIKGIVTKSLWFFPP